MKRKLTRNDSKILAQVIKDHGADWTYKALAVWYGIVPHDELAKVKRWTRRRLGAYRFLREIMDDYTFNAIYNAADEIAKPDALKKVTSAPSIRKNEKHRRKTASAR